jgi:peptidoglycan/LPS O-acetylase OafA/YrhL
MRAPPPNPERAPLTPPSTPAPAPAPRNPGIDLLRGLSIVLVVLHHVTHMFVVLAVVAAFKANGGGLRWGVLWYAPAVALSWLLGWLVARYILAPSERALRARWMRSAAAYPA